MERKILRYRIQLMKTRYIIYSFIAVFLLSSCVKENFTEGFVSDKTVPVTVEFGHSSFNNVEITTKSTLSLIPESRVSNLVVFIFVNGKRYYAHYFDRNELVYSDEALDNAVSNAWTVNQKIDTDPNTRSTYGKLRLFAPKLTGGTLYAFANIDADVVNVSPEQLNAITSETGLLNLAATLNQEITSRNGLFPMTGKLEGVTVNNNKTITVSGGDGKIWLERLDAKVMVNVRVATDYEIESTETEDGTEVTTRQTLKEFRPESWRVVNLPKTTWLLPRGTDAKSEYFSSRAVPFETAQNTTFNMGGKDYTSTVHGFSFYMLENRETAKKSVGGNYHLRDTRVKNETGEYALDENGEKWVYAPEYGTYLEISGEVVMDVDVSSEAKQQQLSGNVVYYIHLGDFGKDRDDYSIERNTSYTYNITIKGVNNIEVEVESSNTGSLADYTEPESGATGDVYIAKESIYTFDAHYGKRVFCFDEHFIEPDNVTWYVSTPFGREGVPEKVGDVELPSGLDYKWVHFVVNRLTDSDKFTCDGRSYTYPGNAKPFSVKDMPWPGDPDDDEGDHHFYEDLTLVTNGVEHSFSEADVMDVVEFTAYIKEQKRRLDAGQSNDFRVEFDQDWFDWYNEQPGVTPVTEPGTDLSKPWFRKRIYVTVFVDEFYYEEHPFSPEIPADELWKQFVNQPNRIMHLLCDANFSYDGESSAVGSVITIRQNSIQTPFNTELDDLKTAWGCESKGEYADSHLFFYSKDEAGFKAPNASLVTDLGNDSNTNGLYNTACILGLISRGNFIDGLEWSDYVSYDRENDHKLDGYTIGYLNEDKSVLRYAAMTLNRDNNGNGIIDPEELRWYIASVSQLTGLYVGGLGLSEEAQLYSKDNAAQEGKFESKDDPYVGADKWRKHVISSTKHSNNRPIMLWAEEGCSTSDYSNDYNKHSPYSIRCIRNLGMSPATKYNIADKNENVPEFLIQPIAPSGAVNSSSVYRFDLRNVNAVSKRFYTTRDLEPADEFSEMARVYEGFETGELIDYSSNYVALKNAIEANEQICPDGYRVPNVREAAIMSLNCADGWWEGRLVLVSTWYSNASKDSNNAGSWMARYNLMTVGINEDSTKGIRCVKDWAPE